MPEDRHLGSRIPTIQGQEDKYHGQVEAVKAEHEQKLREAFERAKVTFISLLVSNFFLLTVYP
jgi:hypothetical protein